MPIYRAKTSNGQSGPKQKGFTLIELLLTLAIVGFVVAIGIPKLGRSLGSQLRATTRRIVIVNREIHHSARLKHKAYRLVIDFGDKEKKSGGSFYVESGSSRELLDDPESTPSLHKSSGKAPPSPFTVDSEILKKPVELPRGVSFEDVEIEDLKKPVTDGKAYIHFFPQGLIQKAIIHITDGKKIHWSLIINSLTANTEIVDEYIKLKDTEL
jgi:general secretion pathway protein H